MSKLINLVNPNLFHHICNFGTKHILRNATVKYSATQRTKSTLSRVLAFSNHTRLSIRLRHAERGSVLFQPKGHLHKDRQVAGIVEDTESDGEESAEENGSFEHSGYNKDQTRRQRDEIRAWTEAADIPDAEVGAFSQFRISQNMIDKLKEKGIPYLFPVQTNTFNSIYDGYDVVVQARTGSGKTLSYAIPLVEKMCQSLSTSRGRSPQMLVMTPTRELARQVGDVINSLSDLSVVCIYGGAPMGPQETKINNGIDVLVGTPGRILDFIERNTLNLKNLKFVVLDEVDRMLDMGFADSVDQILRTRYRPGNMDSNPQTLLFSATVPTWVQRTARKYLRLDIKMLDLVGKGTVRTAVSVQHLAIKCQYYDRARVIGDLLQVYSGNHGRSIVFCETKREADELATDQTIRQEMHVLHGDIPQSKREMVLKGFRDGRYKCLIATDVAARGLDIPEIDLVIQCSPPNDVDSYIHRSGRTGRAGRPGVSILLYKPSEIAELEKVQKIAGFKFDKVSAPLAAEIQASAAEDAVRSINQVSNKISEKFNQVAERLVEEQGAVPALSAALAIICGGNNEKSRSLLTSRLGYTTYIFRTSSNMTYLTYAWKSLERYLPANVNEKIRGMKFCADKQGCVFDVPSELDTVIESSWQDGKYDTLSVADELPEVLEPRAVARDEMNSWHDNENRQPRRFNNQRFPVRSGRDFYKGERNQTRSSSAPSERYSRKGLNDMDD